MLFRIALIVGAVFVISKQFPNVTPESKLLLASAGSIFAFRAVAKK
jgi:hypothetical protein